MPQGTGDVADADAFVGWTMPGETAVWNGDGNNVAGRGGFSSSGDYATDGIAMVGEVFT